MKTKESYWIRWESYVPDNKLECKCTGDYAVIKRSSSADTIPKLITVIRTIIKNKNSNTISIEKLISFDEKEHGIKVKK
jgi:hypothetical protein